MKINTQSLSRRIGGGILFMAVTGLASAANFGTDLNLTMMPAAGGMGGVGLSSPQDAGAAVFGNPSTLEQFAEGRFVLGGTYYTPEVEADHDGLGLTWTGESEAGPYLIPNVAVIQPLSETTSMGLGLSAVSGVGSDFRGVSGSLDPVAEILVFGANAGLSHAISDQLSLGFMATIGFGLGQAGLAENTASTSGFGFRVTLGADYLVDHTRLGFYYRSPLAIQYDNMVRYDSGAFHSPTFEQPAEIGLGISNGALMDGALLIEFNVVLKDWDSAESYQDIYENQTVLAFGAQFSDGDYRWRLGFIHAESPIKQNVGAQVGDIDSLYIEALGGMTPMSAPLTQYVQAVNAEVIWENQLTAGLGWTIDSHLILDLHVALAMEEDEQIGATQVTASAWQTGAALSWVF